MAGSADFIQRAVHALEAGEFAPWIKRGLAVAAIGGLALFQLMHEFRGLATSQAMDQAQIGRELARGHGFSTKVIRPLAVGQLQAHGRPVAQRIGRDTYHAPLPAIVNAVALLPVRSHLKMTPQDIVYVGDKMIALVAILMFIGSVVVLYFTARRLFDERIALPAAAIVLLCGMMWQYALSGLPQMLMLLLFNATVYALLRAMETEAANGSPVRWIAAAGAGFGLLALSNALTLWLFFPAAIFCAFHLKPRGRAALVLLGVCAVVYLPWPIRNALVCGNPLGTAGYAFFDGILRTEAGHMRHMTLDLTGVSPGYFRNKIAGNLLTQFGRLFEHLGWNVVAMAFFAGLLHRFRRDTTAAIQWLLFAMWAGAVAGMAVFGLTDEQGVAANQLHVLFVPLMVCYGLAFLLVLWNRRDVAFAYARPAFLAVLFVLCALPMLATIVFSPNKSLVRWPPYVPPYISVLNTWMAPDEIIATDMPWAVAWYADRRALWLPENVKAMTDFSDYGTLGGPVNGLYLTPVSGGQNKLSDIVRGEYKDWSAVILRTIEMQKFPLKWVTLLGLENEGLFFSDHDRAKQAAAK